MCLVYAMVRITGRAPNGGLSTLSPTHLPRVKQNKQKGCEVPRGLTDCPYLTFSSLLFEDNRWFISVMQIHVLILKPRLRIINRSIRYPFSQERKTLLFRSPCPNPVSPPSSKTLTVNYYLPMLVKNCLHLLSEYTSWDSPWRLCKSSTLHYLNVTAWK